MLVSHDRRLLQTLSRATLWLDRGTIRRLDRGFAAFEAWRDEVFEQEERDRQKLDRKIAAELDWLRYGVTARRSRNQGRLRALHEMRRERREQLRVTGAVKFTVSDAKTSGKLVIEAKDVSKALGGRTLDPRFLDPHRARRPARHRRPERRRQDDAAQHPDRRSAARQRHGAARQPISRSPRSTSAAPASIRRRR